MHHLELAQEVRDSVLGTLPVEGLPKKVNARTGPRDCGNSERAYSTYLHFVEAVGFSKSNSIFRMDVVELGLDEVDSISLYSLLS